MCTFLARVEEVKLHVWLYYSFLPWQGSDKLSAGIRKPYVRVVGIHVETEGPGRTSPAGITPHEEEELRKLAAQPDIYDIIARSIAPSIYGSIGEEHLVYA